MWSLTLLLWMAGPDAAEKVTARNFAPHPAIAAARAVYEETSALRPEGRLLERVRASDDECWDWSELRLAADTASTARYFFRFAGGQDSVHRHHLHYDARGTLRLALLRAGAVNQSTYETRAWFAADGRELYRTVHTTGPGWTWIEGDRRMLVRDPGPMFREGAGSCRLGAPTLATRPSTRE